MAEGSDQGQDHRDAGGAGGGDEFEEWRRRIDAVRRELAHAERRREAAAAELRNLRLDYQAALRKQERERQALEQAEKQRDLLLHTIERLRRELNEVRGAQREIEQQYGRSLAEVDRANSALAEMYRAQAGLVAERDALWRRVEQLEAKLGGTGTRESSVAGTPPLSSGAVADEDVVRRLERELRRLEAELQHRERAHRELEAAHLELEEARAVRRRMEDEIADLNGRLVEMMNASAKQLRDLARQHADAERAWQIERQLLDPSRAAGRGGEQRELLVLDESPAGEELTARLSASGVVAQRLPYDPRLGVDVERWGGKPTAVNLAVPGSWGAVRRLVWRHVTPTAPFYGYAMPPGEPTAFWLGPVSFAILTHGAHGIGPVVRHMVPAAESVVTIGEERLMDQLRADLDQSQIEARYARDGQDARQRMAAREPDALIVHIAAARSNLWRDLLDVRTYVSGSEVPLLFLLDAEAAPGDAVAFSAGMRRLAEAGDLGMAQLAATLAAWHRSQT